MKLLTTPPSTLLLASIERVLREGITQIPALTPAVAWATGQPCPAGHPFFPEGLRIYDYMQCGEISTPSCELLCDEKATEAVDREDRIWKVPVEIDLMWDRDIWEAPEGEQLQAVIKMILTNAITLPDTSIQTAQARLSTAGLHVWGARDADNFTSQSFDKLTANEGHPFMSFSFSVICSGIWSPSGEILNQPVNVTLPVGIYGEVSSFQFRQVTAGVIITLEPPADGFRKVIIVSNTGTASFTLWPGGLSGGFTVAAGASGVILHWDTGVEAWAPGL